jgi:hypothetical protein
MLKRAADSADQWSVLGWLGAVLLWSTLMVLLWRRAWKQSGRVARVTDIVGALVCSAILAFGIVRGIPERPPRNVWETDQGHQMHIGFVTGCRDGAYGPGVACECLFDELKSRPPGDTPSGFTRLTQSIRYATLRGDPRWVRPRAAAAMQACRRVA